MEPRIDSVSDFERMARILVAMIRPILVAEPTRETMQTCIESALNRMTRAAVSAPENERTLSAPIYGIVIQSYMDVLLNSPMYGSHALVLQWDNAIDARMKSFFDRMREKQEEKENARSTSIGG